MNTHENAVETMELAYKKRARLADRNEEIADDIRLCINVMRRCNELAMRELRLENEALRRVLG